MKTFEEIFIKYPQNKSYLFDVLIELQENNIQNYLSAEALNYTQNYFDITHKELLEFISLYPKLSITPRGKYIIQFCNPNSCKSIEREILIKTVKNLLCINEGETTSDGLFTFEIHECLGNCKKTPTMIINKDAYHSLTPEKVTYIIEQYKDL